MLETPAKTILVTGATSGIGFATALNLVRAGHHVLLGARTQQSGESASSRLNSLVPAARTTVIPADLSELAQVRSMAVAIAAAAEPLDGIVLNAGATSATPPRSSDGLDSIFASNYLSGYYLTRMLLPALVASHGRVVTVSSSLHTQVKTLDVARLADTQRTGAPVGYETTKLLNILLVTALAAGHGAGVIASTADPGFVHTNLGRNASRAFRIFLAMTRPFQTTPDAAALTLVHATTSPGVTTTGGYYAKSKPATPSALSQDPVAAEDLWTTSATLLTAKGYTV